MDVIDRIFSTTYTIAISAQSSYLAATRAVECHPCFSDLLSLMDDDVNHELIFNTGAITLLMPQDEDGDISIYDDQLLSLLLILDRVNHGLATELANKIINRNDMYWAKQAAAAIISNTNVSAVN